MHGPCRTPGLLWTAFLASILCTGCVSETVTPTGPAPRYAVGKLETWRVLSAGEPIGRLVLLEIRAGEKPLTYFRAETTSGQWVGYVGRKGRFFKNEPFRPVADGPRDLGLHAMNDGLALLYEVEGPITVVPMEGRGQLTEAAAHKLLREATRKPR